MERTARKLHSERGASMVLALVFLLVCVMVGASVLMAAASNGGRTRSNREEQQVYLALSSALQLVTDDLQNAAYTGKVKYEKEDPPIGSGVSATIFKLSPAEGTLNCAFGGLLRPTLDEAFQVYIHDNYHNSADTEPTQYNYDAFSSAAAQPDPFTLTVTPAADSALAGYAAEITVAVVADVEFLRVHLTARLTKAPDEKTPEKFKDYTLTTELLRQDSVPTLELPTPGASETTGTIDVGPVTWSADRIVRDHAPEPTP